MQPEHMMSDDDLNTNLRLQAEWAKGMVTSVKMKHFPVAVATFELVFNDVTGEPEEVGAALHVLENFPGGNAGRAVFHALGRLKAQQECMVTAVFMLAEAWASAWRGDGPFPYKQVADDPQRVEIIAIGGLTVDQRLAHARIDFSRDEFGYIVPGETTLEPYGDPDSPKMGNSLLQSFYVGYMSEVNRVVAEYDGEHTEQSNFKYN